MVKNIFNHIKDVYQSQIRKISKSDLKKIPNILSLFRIFSVPVIIALYIVGINNPVFMKFAIMLFTTSAISDCVDGIVARKFNMTTQTGQLLDAFADKMFILTLAPMIFLHPSNIVKLSLAVSAFNEVAIAGVNFYGSYNGCDTKTQTIGKLKEWTLFGSGGMLMLSNVFSTLLAPAVMLSATNVILQSKTFNKYLTTYQEEIKAKKENTLYTKEKQNDYVDNKDKEKTSDYKNEKTKIYNSTLEQNVIEPNNDIYNSHYNMISDKTKVYKKIR